MKRTVIFILTAVLLLMAAGCAAPSAPTPAPAPSAAPPAPSAPAAAAPAPPAPASSAPAPSAPAPSAPAPAAPAPSGDWKIVVEGVEKGAVTFTMKEAQALASSPASSAVKDKSSLPAGRRMGGRFPSKL
jgi:hypothetical protein